MYTKEEMIIFSIIYSEIIPGRFTRQKYDSELLSLIFKISLESQINIFKDTEKKKILKLSEVKYEKLYPKKDITKRIEDLENLFSNFEYSRYMEKVKKELELAEENEIKIVTYLDKKYPSNLKELSVPPFVIYYKGYLPNDRELEKSLAVVGARKTDKKYGKKIAQNIGKLLLDNGWWNISGLALGCDEYGHKGSLGATGAILGQGLATPVSPQENQSLAEEILLQGGFLMSELPPSTNTANLYFILRNRLQSGMTKGIFVVQTSESSGTLHTVKYSLEQGKRTYVLDVRGVDDLKNEDVVRGNIKLLDKNEKISGNITLSKKLKEKVIGIRKIKEFEEILMKESKKIQISPLFKNFNIQEKLW